MRLGVVVGLAVACSAGLPAVALDWPGRADAVGADILGRRDAEARAEAVQAVVGLDPAEVGALLERLLADPAPAVRAAAATAVAAVGAVDLTPDLVERLADRDASVRAAAAAALGELRARDAAAAVARVLGDRDATVRVAAVRALAALGSAEAIVAITDALTDRSRDVVVAALSALGTLGQPGSVYAVLERADDPVAEVAIAAIDALVSLRADEAETALVELTQDARPDVARAAIEALGALGLADGVPAVVAEVLSPRGTDGRSLAVEVLVAIGSPAALEPLAPLLGSDPSSVAPYFVAMGPTAWPWFRQAAGGRGPSGVGDPLFRAWLQSGDPAAVDRTVAHLDGGDLASMLFESPTPEAFCTAVEATPGAPEELAAWARWGAAAGAWECLAAALARMPALTPDDAVALAVVAAADAPDLALDVLDTHGDVARLTWESASPIFAALRPGEPANAALLFRLAACDDERVRRESVWAIAQLDPEGLAEEPEGLAAVPGSATPELLPLWAQLHAGRPETSQSVRRIAADAAPRLRATAIRVAGDACALADNELASGVAAPDYWVRRAAFDYARRCGRAEVVLGVVPEPTDPIGRLVAFSRASDEALVAFAGNAAGEPFLRAGAVAELLDRGRAVPHDLAVALTMERSPLLAAAGWLAGAAAELTPEDRVLTAIASPAPAERGALLLGAAGIPPHLRSLARRRESDPGVMRVVDGAPALGSPVEVLVVDRATGEVRRDESVLALLSGGGFAVARTDGAGRATFDREDVAAVFVVAGAE